MKKVLIGVAALVVLLIVAIIAIPLFVPLDTFKDDITAEAEAATGRKLDIAGDLSLSVFPSVAIKVGGVTFANAEGGQAKNMLSLDTLEVEVELMPLLGGEIAVERFILIKPVIALEVDKNGKPNWDFGGGPKAADKPADSASGGGMAVARLGDIRLVDGQLTYRDMKTGDSHEIKDINMSISLPNLDSALDAKGALEWKGEKIELTANIAKPRALSEDGTTPVTADIKANPVTLGFKGNVKGGAAYRVDGTLDLSVPSIRKLAALAAEPIEGGGKGLNQLAIKGNLDMTPKAIAFQNAKINIDQMNADGDVRVALGGARPAINGKLNVDQIDLNLYSDPEAGDKKAEDKPAQKGWSTEPIDVSALKSADADLALTVGKILAQDLKIGKTALDVSLKNGLLVANLKQMALYGGNGTTTITVDGRDKTPKIAQTFSLAGFQAEPFLKDAAGTDRLSGKANAKYSITTSGPHQKALVERLNGSGDFKFTDGAIKGINLGAMVRNVSSAFLDSSARKQQKTDFSELSGTFTIKNGLLTNKDTKLLAPLLRLDAAGTVPLPKQTLNYRVTPKLVASTTGQGGKKDAAGISVPVIVSGPWDDISYKPDLAGMVGGAIKAPGQAVESLKKLKPENLAPKDLKKVLPGGGGGSPEKSLKKLFGR